MKPLMTRWKRTPSKYPLAAWLVKFSTVLGHSSGKSLRVISP